MMYVDVFSVGSGFKVDPRYEDDKVIVRAGPHQEVTISLDLVEGECLAEQILACCQDIRRTRDEAAKERQGRAPAGVAAGPLP